MIIDRTKERKLVEEHVQRTGPQLGLISGRRHIGKTEFLRRLCGGKAAFYHAAGMGAEQDQLRALTSRIEQLSSEPAIKKATGLTWAGVLGYLFERLSRKIPLLIIDDFQNLYATRKDFPSLLASVWEEKAKGRSFCLVLSGSDMNLMRRLSGKDGALGRQMTFYLELSALGFAQTATLLRGYSTRDRIVSYGILGGNPGYLSQFDSRKPVEQNIRNRILDVSSFLYREPLIILTEGLREPAIYLSILKTLSQGHDRLPEIVLNSGLRDIHFVNKYLFVLKKQGVVSRVVPVTEASPETSRKGRYFFEEPYFRFWSRYVYPHRSDLEMGDVDRVWKERIKPDLDRFLQSSYQDICLENLKRLNTYNKLPFKARRIGRWWSRGTDSLLVAMNEEGLVLFCDCLWMERMAGSRELGRLKQNARRFPRAKKAYYGLFSKSGFSKELEAQSRAAEDILFFDVA